MATIVNNPGNAGESNNGSGFLMGVVLLIIVGLLFFYFGLPALRQATPQQDINVEVPQQAPSDVNVDVPDEIDVNVTNPDDAQ